MYTVCTMYTVYTMYTSYIMYTYSMNLIQVCALDHWETEYLLRMK